jgi:hypothetical protein
VERDRPQSTHSFADAQRRDLLQALRRDAHTGTTQTLPLRSRTRQTGSDALLNAARSNSAMAQDVELEPTGWCRCVDSLVQADEVNAEGAQLVE